MDYLYFSMRIFQWETFCQNTLRTGPGAPFHLAILEPVNLNALLAHKLIAALVLCFLV